MHHSNSYLFEQITHQVNKIGDITTVAGGIDYQLNKDHLITTFALNVFLVLQEKRLAYRADIPNLDINNYMLNFVTTAYPDLMIIPLPKEEPLLLLRKTEKFVLNMLKEVKDEISFHIAIGKILEYAYNGPNWIGNTRDMYTIHYIVEDAQDGFHLTQFNVPVDEYNTMIKDKILQKENDYQRGMSSLEKHNFIVKTRCSLQTLEGDYKMLEKLPEY